MSTLVPGYGLARVIPDNATAAWGARAIVSQNGTFDLPPDRQGLDGPDKDRLLVLLNERLPGRELQDIIRGLLRDDIMRTREAEDFILYMDDDIVMHANTNASAGYCYITAWLAT